MNSRVPHFILTVIAFCAMSCIRLQQENPESTQISLKDTLTVKGDVVVFYYPSEFEKWIADLSDEEMKTLFKYEMYAESLSDQLIEEGMLAFATSALYISLETDEGIKVLGRPELPGPTGMILCSPEMHEKVISGEWNEDSRREEIRAYFSKL